MTRAFTNIADMLKARSGLVIGPEKLYLLQTRLAPILKNHGLPDLGALADCMRPNTPLEREVVDAMTTNESLFFRDAKPFDALRQTIFPRLHATRPAGIRLRVWSAAASTGQEAYSIAMVAAGLAGAMPGRQVEILGTDIAREPLERARIGLYTQFEIQRGLPMQMLVKHFVKQGGQFRVSKALRDAVNFKEWNLLSDLRALGAFDVVFCRNVLIYFDTATKNRVLDAIARQMPSDGVLVLGGAETVLGLTDAFRPVPGGSGLYTRAEIPKSLKGSPKA
jgi:chemotaxis protein methyltransferase CheR